jgi:hypothetical protein
LWLQEAARGKGPSSCFFAIFHTVKAAQTAASLHINPPLKRMVRLVEGVDPNNINWQTVSTT